MSERRMINIPIGNKIIKAVIEPDGDYLLLTAVDLPLYAVGGTEGEAIEGLNHEIVSLYEDLMEDDNFTDDWIPIKQYLIEIFK